MSRSPLFSRLKRVASRVLWARGRGIEDPSAIDAAWREEALRRRDFMKLSAGALGVAAMPGVLASCSDDATVAPDDARIAIIGAGLAGMHCAYRLAQAGVKATIYEAGSRIGGRTFSARDMFPEGQVAELGGELIDSNHATLLALKDELGIQLDDRFADEPVGYLRDVWWVNGASVPEATIVEQFTNVAPLMAQMVEMAESDDAAFEALDATTLADWLATNVPVATYPELNAVLDAAYRGEFGLESAEQSALNLLYLIDYETPDPFRIFGDSDERWHAHDGNQVFVERMAEALDADQIQLDTRLTGLHDAEGGGYRLELARQGGTVEVTVDHVVLALPFTLLREVTITAQISDVKREIITELGYGTNAKVMGAFTAKVWRSAHNSSGSATTDLPFQQSWDTSIGQPGTSGLLTNFLGGSQGVEAGAQTAEDWFQGVVLPGIEQVFPGTAETYVAQSAVMMHWPTAPLAKGSYTCYRPGQWAYWSMEGVREGNIHFCGEHCSLEFQGWMEGAAETGAVVAAEILDDLGMQASALHRRVVERVLAMPHPCYHGQVQTRPAWRTRRQLMRQRLRRMGL